MDEIYELFKEKRFDEAKTKLKNKLKNDINNSELLYKLFLAENEDYANLKADDIKSEVSFNQALEHSTAKKKKLYEFEFNFFKNLNETYRKAFCYALRGNVKDLIDVLKNEDLSVDKLDTSKISEFFDYYYKDNETLYLGYHILNIIYVFKNDENIKKKLKAVQIIINNNKTKYVYLMTEVRSIIVHIEKEYDLYVPTPEEIKEKEEQEKKEALELERIKKAQERIEKKKVRKENREYKAIYRHEKRHDPARIAIRKERIRTFSKITLHVLILVFSISVLGAFGFFGSRLIRMDGYGWPRNLWFAANTQWAFTDFVQVKSLMTLIGWLFQAVWFLFTWLLWAIIWVVLVVLCGVLYALMYGLVPVIVGVLLALGSLALLTLYYGVDLIDIDDVTEMNRWDKILIVVIALASVIWVWFIPL